MKQAYKVVSIDQKGRYRSAVICGWWRQIYPLGKKTNARKGSLGVLCFEKLKQAEKFKDNQWHRHDRLPPDRSAILLVACHGARKKIKYFQTGIWADDIKLFYHRIRTGEGRYRNWDRYNCTPPKGTISYGAITPIKEIT
jgi:hypothetical protein